MKISKIILKYKKILNNRCQDLVSGVECIEITLTPRVNLILFAPVVNLLNSEKITQKGRTWGNETRSE